MKFKDLRDGVVYGTWNGAPCDFLRYKCADCPIHLKYDEFFNCDVSCADIIEDYPEAARLVGFEPIPDAGDLVPKPKPESEKQTRDVAKPATQQTDWSKLPPIKVGQHIPLSPGLLSIDDSGEGSFFTMTKKMVVEFAKSTDQALINAIIARAKAEGVTDLYILDDEFILAAIREKIEREGHESEESNRAGL